MQTTSPIINDEPAIPEQYRHSIQAAHAFAVKAHGGARANYRRCKSAGVSDDMLSEAQQHVYGTLDLLHRLTPRVTGRVVQWKWNERFGEHEVYLDGELVVSHPRMDYCDIKLNERVEWDRTVARKAALLITPAALATTLTDDDEPVDIDAEYELMNAGEKKPVKEPYVKNAWDKANAHFRAEAAFIAPGKETPFTRSKRLEQLTRFVGRPITSTRDMTPDELTRAAFAIHDNQLSWAYERAAEKAA